MKKIAILIAFITLSIGSFAQASGRYENGERHYKRHGYENHHGNKHHSRSKSHKRHHGERHHERRNHH